MSEHRFWLVWRENGGPPTYRHGSEAAATSEANRLASLYPGERFVVLAAKAAYAVPRPKMQRIAFKGRARPIPPFAGIDDDDIPF